MRRQRLNKATEHPHCKSENRNGEENTYHVSWVAQWHLKSKLHTVGGEVNLVLQDATSLDAQRHNRADVLVL